MNNNITEDYCSFEVSKLLKEKGFAVYCTSLYTEDGKQNDVGNYNGVDDDNYISFSRPTHALAIKWIRENFGIHIQPTKPFHKDYWVVDKIPLEFRVKGHENSDSFGVPMSHANLDGKFNSPEEATEAALLYTLKNLI